MFDWLFRRFQPDREEVTRLRQENRDLGRELAGMQLALAMMRVQRDDALKMSERRDRHGRFVAQGARLTDHRIDL
ncbi:hypothetical protein [Gluconacetobacter entanii]|uniref:hypothetical protein n=2 Tax=Gluconacetobacter entanii TaxID=108528 RepID=UPI00223575C3|nr:hypothetical protein [Gluconacetobacter entanii]MCW4581224.1 hypothetical protein [Gluconacetobacter entanii]MCW4584484.1 hypothetical protein [Gluconacetobacter entanii]MCW4587852.1 hypothetical protein [Gluconacetobacter entanii]